MINISKLYRAQGKCIEADLLYRRSEKIMKKRFHAVKKTPAGFGMCIKSIAELNVDKSLDIQT